jgi:GNAT superfamily N-acetyltransferase
MSIGIFSVDIEMFQRRDGIQFPTIYQTFKAKNKDGSELTDYIIQDLTEKYYQDASKLIENFILPEETFCKALQISEKKAAARTLLDGYQELFRKNLSLICIDNSSGELVGLNVLSVKSKQPQDKLKLNNDPDVAELRMTSKFTSSLFDVFEHYQIDHFLNANGLGVHQKYRGRGIAVELLKARVPLMKAIGLTVTSTVFSTLGSQIAARKAGFDESASISYAEIQKRFPQYDFSFTHATHHCKTFTFHNIN